MKFKIGDQVLLHHTKTEKQWSRKFDPKWDGSFHIHEALGNEAYKLRLEDRILKKVAHGNHTKIRAGEGRTKVQLELNVLFSTHHPKGNMEGKIAFRQEGEKKETKNEKKLEEIKKALARGTKLPETGEWTPDNVQELKEKLLPAYWFYKIKEQLDLKTPYEDLSQKTFNKEAIQQQYTDYTPPFNIAQTIEQIINQQFEDLQKAILEATIEHYTNEATITDTYGFAGAQF
ncbi:hypothetical protein G9A89_004130 [Geosiphon pyriformis]|nr:hypothetical protein G9A89_004130 [Geosiphon pyriformis]